MHIRQEFLKYSQDAPVLQPKKQGWQSAIPGIINCYAETALLLVDRCKVLIQRCCHGWRLRSGSFNIEP